VATNVFSLSEHDLIIKGKDIEESREESFGVVLRERDFDALELWVAEQMRQEEKSRQLPPAKKTDSSKAPIRYDARKRGALRVQNFVGIVQLPSGDSLEILPKIARKLDENSKERGRKILLSMLSTVHNFPHITFRHAGLDSGRMPLLEVFIICFLDDIGALIRRGISSGYAPVEENLQCLRGKLLMPHHIRANSIHRERFYVSYDEYLPDRAENRLLKTALSHVHSISRNLESKRRGKRFLDMFEDVPFSCNIRDDFAASANLDRNTRHYRTPLFWSRLLLRGETPIPSPGDLGCTAVLFPMERLFEAYVAIHVRRKLSPGGWNVIAQAKREYLVEEHQNTPFHTLKPDLLLERKMERIIADTKWKHIVRKDDVSSADMYQLFAYSEKYMVQNPTRLSFLIYPKTDSFCEPLPDFHFYKDTAILRAVPFDLETNDCPLFEYLNEQAQPLTKLGD
jgi:5-methylcytosine-specific restriction enzyme subunit McrC